MIKREYTQQDGITLLITLLLVSVLLAITASLLNVTIQQFQISGIGLQSEMAFQAANAGIECARYWDVSKAQADGGSSSKFDVLANGGSQSQAAQITCMGDTETNSNGAAVSGDEQAFQFNWGSPSLCTKVSVYKYKSDSSDLDMYNSGIGNSGIGNGSNDRDCAQDFECTVVVSRGYNSPCGSLSNSRTVERKLVQVY